MATDASPTNRLQRLVLGLLAAILALILICAIGGGIYALSRLDALTPTYAVSVTTPDAGGIDAGASVQMAGVPVGVVERAMVQDGQAHLLLRIRQEDQIPSGSRYVIVPVLFSMPALLKIIPPPSAGTPPGTDARLASGGTLPDAQASLTQANAMIRQWSQVGQKTTQLLDATTRTTRHLDAVLNDETTRERLRQTLADVQTTSHNTALITAQVNAITQEARPQVRAILASTVKTTAAAGQIAAQGHQLLQAAAKGGGVLGKPSVVKQVAKTAADLTATIANLKDLTAKMNVIAGNLQSVSSDPQVASDLKSTLHNLQAITVHMDTLTANAQAASGDPQTRADLKTTLHNLAVLTQTTQDLLTKLDKVAGKATGK